MAKVEGEYISVNELFGNKSGSASGIKGLRYNGVVERRAILNGVIKFDHWYTTLSASDSFSIGASGGNVASYISVESYGVDVNGEKHDVGYTFSPETISANSSESSKNGSVIVTQKGSGKFVSVSYKQSGVSVNWTVSASVRVGVAPASGGWMDVTVDWVLYRNGSYYTQGSSTPSSVYMDNSYQSSSQVYVPSAGTEDFSSEHTIGYITSCIFYADGKYFDESFYTAVRRAKNMPSRSWGAYELSISSSKSSFPSSANSATITVDCKQNYTDTWDSGSKSSDKANATASLSTTYGSLSDSSVTGRGSVTLSVGNDEGNGYTAKVTASAGNGTKKESVSIPQTKRVASGTSYSEPSVAGTYQDANIPAWGGYAYLMVNWSQTKYTNYDNGTTSNETVTGTSRAVILGGTVQQTGASLQSDGGIYKSSCGTTVTPQRAVYTVSAYYFQANGVGRDVRPVTIHLGQAPNSETGTKWLGTYNISISYSPTGNLSNAGGTKTISVNCTENGTITYTSTATKATTRNATATLTTTAGTLSPTSITGNGTSTLTVLENTGAQRTITVTAKAGSTSKTTSFVQNAVAWVFTAATTRVEVAYNATSVTLSGTSSRNGFYQDISKSNVSASSGTVGTVTSSGTTFNIPITFTANSNTTSKTITVTVTQPLSGNKLTYTIVQAAKPAETNWIQWRDNRGTWSPATSGRFTFSAALLYNKELHGKGATVSIIPMKGSTEITSATSVALNGTSYNANMYVQNISIIVRTTNDGSIFYLKAIYGNDTEIIQLDSDLT